MRADKYFAGLPRPSLYIVKVADMIITRPIRGGDVENGEYTYSPFFTPLCKHLRQSIDYYVVIKNPVLCTNEKFGFIVTCDPSAISGVHKTYTEGEFLQKCVGVEEDIVTYDRYGERMVSLVPSYWTDSESVMRGLIQQLKLAYHITITRCAPSVAIHCPVVRHQQPEFVGRLLIALMITSTKGVFMKPCHVSDESPIGVSQDELNLGSYNETRYRAVVSLDHIDSNDVLRHYHVVDDEAD